MESQKMSVLQSIKLDGNQERPILNYQLERKLKGADNTFAQRVDMFLRGKINSLPNYEAIDKLRKVSGKIISIGSGVIVSASDDGILIESTQPLDYLLTRVDFISKDTYEAYVSDDIAGNLDNLREIDVSIHPRFDSRRVVFLQKYLANCNGKKSSMVMQKKL